MKVRAWLSQEGVELEARDFFEDTFTGDELRTLIEGRSPSDVFSWKSPSFRKLGAERASLSDDQLISLMLDEPRLIRRPLVLVNGELVIGGDTGAISRALAP